MSSITPTQRLDRQTRTLGIDATRKLSESSCLIVNLGGLGVEIAKSLILMGLKRVHIYESKACITPSDLSTQFFCASEARDEDLYVPGTTRASVSLRKLKELNPACDIDIVGGENTQDGAAHMSRLMNLIPSYNIVVFTDMLLRDLVPYNELCREHNVKFIACETRGVFGSIFNDFGDAFVVNDLNGENPQSSLIINLTQDENGNGIVDFHDEENEKPLKLYTGDKIKITNVEGLDELNGQVREIERTEMWKLNIGPISHLKGSYKGGGYFEEVKQSKSLSFRSLKQFLENPSNSELLDYDTGKMDFPAQLQVAFESLHQFVHQKSGSNSSTPLTLEQIEANLPRSYIEEDAEVMLQLASKIAESRMVEITNPNIVRTLAYTARGQINPVVTFIGGIVGQEVQKAVTGKFHPIHQCFNWECVDVLPDPIPTPEDCAPQQSRYDGQIAVFGQKFQKKLGNLRYFMIGAGALGCEFLKNFALMGIACGPKGKITVTDMDTIEVSNLSRQFLFNETHVGEMKSTCAATAAKRMNPNLNIDALLDRVGPETEDTFNEKFWTSLSGVITALDNVAARKYVDEKCVLHRLPMIDSGTLGPNSHVQVVSPHAKTECYRSKKEPETIEFAFCTVHFHPNIIEHTITWAKNYFAGVFETATQEVNSFLKDPKAYLDSDEKGMNVMSLETVFGYLVGARPRSYVDCIQWARQQHENLFNYGIRNVLLTYPPERVTSSGAPFWSGSKRCPTPINFNPSDEMSRMFIEAVSRVYAHLYEIPVDESVNVQEVLESAPVHPFVPNPVRDESKQDEQPSEEELRDRAQKEKDTIEQQQKHLKFLRERLSDLNQFVDVQPMKAIEFEKDDDSNYHVEFITSASNLRARAYRIPEADRHTTKGIAGNIIPAMITTTALTTGLVCTELYKVIQEKDRKYLRDAFIKLAIPSFQQWKPKKAGVEFAGRFTLWDLFVVDEGKDITLGEVIQILRDRFNIEPLGFTYFGNMVWSIMTDAKTKQAREQAPLAKMIQMLQQKKFPSSQQSLTLTVTGQDIDDPQGEIHDQLPPLVYRFKSDKTATNSSASSDKLRAAKARAALLAKKRKKQDEGKMEA